MRRAVSPSWIMKCPQKRVIFHVLLCQQDEVFEILPALGWERRRDGEGERDAKRDWQSQRGETRDGARIKWIDTIDACCTPLFISPPLSNCVAARSGSLDCFTCGHFGAESLRAYHEVYRRVRPLVSDLSSSQLEEPASLEMSLGMFFAKRSVHIGRKRPLL